MKKVLSLCLVLSLYFPSSHGLCGDDVVPPQVDELYRKGLGYLILHQNSGGAWDDSYGTQPGVVGLCLLAMLANGEDPNQGELMSPVRQGLRYVLQSADSDSGMIGTSMYNHGLATLALAEAYGHVQMEGLDLVLQQAVSLILKAQSSNLYHAWRYSHDSQDADTTVSGANLVALFAAKNSGIHIPKHDIERALGFYALCQAEDGGIGYTEPGSSSPTTTAIACLVYALAKKRTSAVYKRAFDNLRSREKNGGRYHYYYLYYASQAFFHDAPENWSEFNKQNIINLAQTQNSNGSWEGEHGAAFSTAAALLSLALNYRYLPIYER